MKNLDSVLAAYLAGWAIFFVYYISVSQRMGALREEVERLKGLINKTSNPPTSAPARKSEFEKETTRVYRADGWNIEFDIPVDWEILFENRPEPPNYGVLGVVGKRATGPRPSVLVMTQVLQDTGEGLDAYMNGAEGQLRKMFANFSMIKKWQAEYQGAPSAVMEYSYQGNNGPIQELNMTTFFGERMRLAFQFICEASKAEVAQDRALQRRIIDSIRIGSRGIRVPYLKPYGRAASTCAACGESISEPNALFNGRKPAAFYCNKCWQTA